jgi:hypothetical protein
MSYILGDSQIEPLFRIWIWTAELELITLHLKTWDPSTRFVFTFIIMHLKGVKPHETVVIKSYNLRGASSQRRPLRCFDESWIFHGSWWQY